MLILKNSFLILLLSVITFCASSQVTITEDVARFFLEQNEKVKIYEKIIVSKDSRISLLEQKIVQQGVIISTYESDSRSFRGIINTNEDQLKFKDKQLEAAEKNIKRLKRQRNIVAGAGIGAAAGSVIGPEGALVGGLIGGGVGIVISWVKK
jgi:hypothetical protein